MNLNCHAKKGKTWYCVYFALLVAELQQQFGGVRGAVKLGVIATLSMKCLSSQYLSSIKRYSKLFSNVI